jgi:hypothetical protein
MARDTAMTREQVLANPGAAQAALDGAKEAAKSPLPKAEFPPDDLVTLPAGYVHEGELLRRVTVRELTGEDEEALARAIQSPNIYHFLDVLVNCGVERIGTLDRETSLAILPDLLVGDRDEIILGIRRVTYGDTVEVFNWQCYECGRRIDKIEFSLSEDVDRVTMKDPANEAHFTVKLRGGGSAVVNLATARVLTATYEMDDLTTPQRNDVMLSKTVETWTDRNGQIHLIPGFPSMVRQMSTTTRQTILRELSKRQPGPRYNEIKFKHEECGAEVTLALGIADLFRDLLAGL